MPESVQHTGHSLQCGGGSSLSGPSPNGVMWSGSPALIARGRAGSCSSTIRPLILRVCSSSKPPCTNFWKLWALPPRSWAYIPARSNLRSGVSSFSPNSVATPFSTGMTVVVANLLKLSLGAVPSACCPASSGGTPQASRTLVIRSRRMAMSSGGLRQSSCWPNPVWACSPHCQPSLKGCPWGLDSSA